MKRCFFLILSLLSIGLCHSQVGINVKSPQGTLHVDPRSDTSGSSGTSDDVIVTAAGNVGVGTLAPTNKLHIKTTGTVASPVSGFRLEDGNQGAGKVLTQMASGLATWRQLVTPGAIYFTEPPTTPRDIPVPTNNYYNTASTITLPPGRWVLMVVMYLTVGAPYSFDDLCTINSTFADDTTVANDGQPLASVVTPDIEGARLVSGLSWAIYLGGMMNGALVINNTSAASKKYYYMVGGTSGFTSKFVTPGGGWNEDSIVAFRIPADL